MQSGYIRRASIEVGDHHCCGGNDSSMEPPWNAGEKLAERPHSSCPGFAAGHFFPIRFLAKEVDMRDDHYRQLCDNPSSYDKVIDWIKANNPAAPTSSMYSGKEGEERAEEFASGVVNYCISSVVYSESLMTSTGMAMAIKTGDGLDESLPGKPVIKAILAIKLEGVS